MTIEKNSNKQHGKANGHIPDQVYRATDVIDRECWRVAYKGRVVPTDFTSREAAEAYLLDLQKEEV